MCEVNGPNALWSPVMVPLPLMSAPILPAITVPTMLLVVPERHTPELLELTVTKVRCEFDELAGLPRMPAHAPEVLPAKVEL